MIGLIRVPGIADYILVGDFFHDRHDLRILVMRLIDRRCADRTKLFNESNLLLGRQCLVTKKDHQIIEQRLTNIFNTRHGQVLRKINAQKLRANRSR